MRSERHVRTCTLLKPGPRKTNAGSCGPSGAVRQDSSAPSPANRRIRRSGGPANHFSSPHAWHYDVVAIGIVTDITARSRRNFADGDASVEGIQGVVTPLGDAKEQM